MQDVADSVDPAASLPRGMPGCGKDGRHAAAAGRRRQVLPGGGPRVAARRREVHAGCPAARGEGPRRHHRPPRRLRLLGPDLCRRVQPGPRAPIRNRGHPGTNHTSSSFRKVGIYPGAGFQTPLGAAAIDSSVVDALLAACQDCTLDASIHAREHSVEVVVPFVQVLFPGAKIVPAIVGAPDVETCERFGKALAKTLKGRNALIVASTDLSHYPSAANASMVDRQTLQAILPLDPASFHAVAHTASDRNIRGLSTRACGEAPVMAAMAAARELGATGGVLVSYAHSGETVLGDRGQVVGYGAVALASGKTGAGDAKTPASQQAGSGSPLNASDRKAASHTRTGHDREIPDDEDGPPGAKPIPRPRADTGHVRDAEETRRASRMHRRDRARKAPLPARRGGGPEIGPGRPAVQAAPA